MHLYIQLGSLHLVILKTGAESSSETPVHMYQDAMHTSVLYKNKQSMCVIFFSFTPAAYDC